MPALQPAQEEENSLIVAELNGLGAGTERGMPGLNPKMRTLTFPGAKVVPGHPARLAEPFLARGTARAVGAGNDVLPPATAQPPVKRLARCAGKWGRR